MLEKLFDQNIVIGKLPASTAEITQPCDARHCFIGPKTALKKINNCDFVGKYTVWGAPKISMVLSQFIKINFTNGLLRVP